MTLEFWLYPKRLPEIGKIWYLIQKPGCYEIRLVKVKDINDPLLQFIAGNFYAGATMRELELNRWTHIAINFRKDEPPFFSRVLVNGKSKIESPRYPLKWQLPLSDSPMYIGKRFEGAIDEIRISNTVRYQGNFELPSRRFESDKQTMALWHFDGVAKAALEDASGNENHLSIGVNPFPTDSSGRPLWQTKAPMPTPRTEMSAIALGKKIYTFGGFDNKDQFTTTEIYDSETDSWSVGAPVPEHVNHSGIGVVNGKIYVIGGGQLRNYRSCWEYDPTRNTWSKKADMIHGRLASWVAELDGKLYAIGGLSDNNRTNVAPIEVYDPITDTWQEKAPLPTPRDHLVVAAVNGKIYAIGGRGLEVKESNLVHEYDPKLDSWRSKSSMPTPRSGMMVAVINKKIHVIGGEGLLTDAHEIYDPTLDRWEAALPMPTARSGLAGGVIDDNIYAIGGHGADLFNTNEVFFPSIFDMSTSVSVEARLKYLTSFGALKQNALGQNFPNPFNPETWIPYQLANSSEVRIKIYAATGNLVRSLELGTKEAGIYITQDKAAYWDGRNEAGEPLSSGLYFYELVADNFRSVRKMVILK